MSHTLFLRFSLLITTLKLVQFQIKESSNTWIILSVSCLNGKANKSGQVIAISLLNKSVEQIPSFYFEKKKKYLQLKKMIIINLTLYCQFPCYLLAMHGSFFKCISCYISFFLLSRSMLLWLYIQVLLNCFDTIIQRVSDFSF